MLGFWQQNSLRRAHTKTTDEQLVGTNHQLNELASAIIKSTFRPAAMAESLALSLPHPPPHSHKPLATTHVLLKLWLIPTAYNRLCLITPLLSNISHGGNNGVILSNVGLGDDLMLLKSKVMLDVRCKQGI
jgi:hypothetical protein